MKFSELVLPVIVLYNKPLHEAASFITLGAALVASKQVADVLVYDNSPRYNAGADFDATSGWQVSYYADNDNSGVSAGYNMAAAIAEKTNKKFILLLDQDTDFPATSISAYEAALTAYPLENIFAPVMLTHQNEIISPCEFRLMRGYYAKSYHPGINSLNGKSLINCGLCIRTSAFNAAGGYNELIKLDFSDHDFVRRYAKKVSDSFVVIDLIVRHGLSTSEKQSFKSDLARFNYYLEGGRYFSKSTAERWLVGVHAVLRGLKLSFIHKKVYFLSSALTYFFSSK